MNFTVMNFIKYNNYYFIQKNNLNNVPEEIEGFENISDRKNSIGDEQKRW